MCSEPYSGIHKMIVDFRHITTLYLSLTLKVMVEDVCTFPSNSSGKKQRSLVAISLFIIFS